MFSVLKWYFYLSSEKIFKPRPQSGILVPLRVSFPTFLMSSPALFIWEYPPGTIPGFHYPQDKLILLPFFLTFTCPFENSLAGTENETRGTRCRRRWPAEGAGRAESKMAKHHPDLIMCRKQPGVGKCQCNGRLIYRVENTEMFPLFILS